MPHPHPPTLTVPALLQSISDFQEILCTPKKFHLCREPLGMREATAEADMGAYIQSEMKCGQCGMDMDGEPPARPTSHTSVCASAHTCSAHEHAT